VVIERNPWAAERLSPKELLNMEWIWIPNVQHTDPEIAENLRRWMASEYRNHPDVYATVQAIKKKILERTT
jgi:hypothetical protein